MGSVSLTGCVRAPAAQIFACAREEAPLMLSQCLQDVALDCESVLETPCP